MDKPIHPRVVELQGRMFAARVKIGAVLRRAKVNGSTWHRWVHGAEPKLSSLERMDKALAALTAEAAAAAE